MSQNRIIRDFFKRPHFSLPRQEVHENKQTSESEPPSTIPTSPPLPDLSSPFKSPPQSSSPNGPGAQLKGSLLFSINNLAEDEPPQQQSQPADSEPGLSSFGGSFNSSQRIVKNGKEVVISSDGEDTESIESLEAPEDLFKQIIDPDDGDVDGAKEASEQRTTQFNKTGNMANTRVSNRKYKFTLDSLVTDAVDDQEVEAGVAQLRAALEKQGKVGSETAVGGKELREDMLVSALGGNDDESGFQRLLDAVRRTEALDQEKSWSFFDRSADIPRAPKFPRGSFSPGTWESNLRDPLTRERAIRSGILEIALQRDMFPDELIIWIFQSVPSESRDDVRHAYCRLFKNVTSERVKSLIRPSHVDDLFRQLGAKPQALALSEPISPEPSIKPDSSDASRESSSFLAVLDLLRGAADLFADDTREHILQILFRLVVDKSLTRNSNVCSELERTITAVLNSSSDDNAETMMQRVCTSVYSTIKDAALQGCLLKHVLPTSDWIALFRCRLAIAFLIRNISPLTEPPDEVLNLKRITTTLKDRRFNVKLYKGRSSVDFDYEDLGAITVLLNVAIDSGLLQLKASGKEAETEFNADVDALADRIKKIFTSIEDSGASHLKRTQAKEALEALHYRVVYSVRSKPPPKKSFFGAYSRGENGQELSRSGSFMHKFLSSHAQKNKDVPIRAG